MVYNPNRSFGLPEPDTGFLTKPKGKTTGAAVMGTKKPGEMQVFRDERTGELSGVVKPDGTVLLGLSPEEIRDMAERRKQKTELPAGTVEVSKVAALEEQQKKGAELATQVGGAPVTPIEQPGVSPIEWGRAAGAGLGAAAPSALGGAAAGAVGGLIAGAPLGPGALITAGLGAIGGFLVGMRSNLKTQTGEEIKAAAGSLKKRDTLLRGLITDTNQDPSHAAENLQMFNQQMAYLERDYGKLHLEAQRSLNTFTGNDGSVELTKYEVFYSPGGTRDFLVSQMQTALINPNPAKSLLTMDDIQETEE